MEKKTIVDKEETKAVEVYDRPFLEGEPEFWIEDFRDNVGEVIEGVLYDILKKNGGGLDNFVYIKKVANHLEIGAVKKIEVIY